MKMMGKKTTTDNFELMRTGQQLLGDKFAGVYSSDQRPALSKKKAVRNSQHEASLVRRRTLDCPCSYALDWQNYALRFVCSIAPTTISKSMGGRGNRYRTTSELDVEQDEQMTECGQRSLAWLLLFDQFGSSAAKMI